MGLHSALEDRFAHLVLFDTETTGIEPKNNHIIELGGVRVSGGAESGSCNTLIRLEPGCNLPPFITDLTGITQEDLARDGAAPEAAAAEFCRLLDGEDTLLVAYNAQFDLNFLYYFLRRTGHDECLRRLKFLDALTVYRDRRDYPHKLKDAIAAYRLEDRAVNSHRAVDDARAMMELLWAMAEEKDDLLSYVNLFGYNPRYGISGRRISSVTYLPQNYQRGEPLYAGR